MPEPRKVVPFPESARERKRLLRKSEDPRLRIVSILASVCGWLFTLAVVLFGITNYRLLMPDSIQRTFGYLAAGLRTTSSDAATISYASGAMRDAELFGGGLAYSDSDTLYVSKPNGIHQLALQVSFSDPVVETSDSLILAYDRGGNNAVLANVLTSVCEVSTDSPIISGAIGENGGFVLITDEAGYKTAATVYNNNGEQIFRWASSESGYYILSAAISPDGNYLATIAFRQDGIDLQSDLLLWRMGQEEVETTYSLGGALGYEVQFLGANIAVATDRGAFLVDRRGELVGHHEVPSRDLIGYAFCDRGILLVTIAYQGTARAEVNLLSTNGNLTEEPIYLSAELQHISAAGSVFGVLTSEGVTVYSAGSWAELWSNDSVTGARGLRMDASGAAYVLYGSVCRILR